MASLRPCCTGPAIPKQACATRKSWAETNARTMSSRLAYTWLGNVSSTKTVRCPCVTSKLASRAFVPPMSPAKIMSRSFSLASLALPDNGSDTPCSAPALGNHDGSTINIIRLSSNVVGVRRGQKNSHSSDIFRLIPTPSGEGSDTPLDFLLHRNLVPLSSCVHRHHRHVSDSSSRTNSIDINMMRSEGHGSTLCHGNHASLTDSIMQEMRLRLFPGNRSGINNLTPTPLLDHLARHRLHDKERPFEVDIAHKIPIYLGDIQDLLDAQYTSIIHQDIYAPHALDAALDHLLNISSA